MSHFNGAPDRVSHSVQGWTDAMKPYSKELFYPEITSWMNVKERAVYERQGMDFGDLGAKLATIKMIRNQRLAKGEPASEIIVIDSRKKPAESQRK